MIKTNVMYLLDAAHTAYKIGVYEVDRNDLSDSHATDFTGTDCDRMHKTPVLKGGRKGYLAYCVSAGEELDLKKVARAVGEKKVEMICVKDMLGITDYIHGGCFPVDMKKHFLTYIEEMAQLYDTATVSAEQGGVQVTLSLEDLRSYVEGQFVSLV